MLTGVQVLLGVRWLRLLVALLVPLLVALLLVACLVPLLLLLLVGLLGLVGEGGSSSSSRGSSGRSSSCVRVLAWWCEVLCKQSIALCLKAGVALGVDLLDLRLEQLDICGSFRVIRVLPLGLLQLCNINITIVVEIIVVEIV